ncbi:MAG TPA: branched-chain amino acid dehydrogenase [Fusobacteriaceae bacterium]|nr:branched-chain amino acid dehydrogenase [Fusobacteriaceae bacterium]
MSKKIIDVADAVSKIEDGMTIMIGGFLGNGSPHTIIDALVKKGVKNLTIITNDTGIKDSGVGRLIYNNMVSKVIASHIGTNPETGRQMNEKIIEVELVPQGTLAERIRSGGAGLGGVLTPTGLGTIVAEGKQIIEVDNKLFILEKPLRADVSILLGETVDKKGNIIYSNTARNFNPVMATAADIVIVEAENIVEVGTINPNEVVTPRIFVDYIVGSDYNG